MWHENNNRQAGYPVGLQTSVTFVGIVYSLNCDHFFVDLGAVDYLLFAFTTKEALRFPPAWE